MAVALALAVGAPTPGMALGLFSHHGAAKPVKPAKPDKVKPGSDAAAAALAAQVEQALDERRYVDAGTLLDQALAQNLKSTALTRLTGELLLARDRYADAVDVFHSVENDPTQRAKALAGEGIALSLLGRTADALLALQQAVDLDKGQWRAWNGLGREYDLRHDWAHSAAAYEQALAAPGANAAVILNNRGYSRLLQHQTDLAAADFVAALQKDPSLAEARTNLRMTLAMQGHYDRAAITGVGDDRAAVLNNIGLAAVMRGDYAEADKLLGDAMAAKGQFYSRAAENLQLSHELAAHHGETAGPADVAH